MEQRVAELTGVPSRSSPLRAAADVSVVEGGVLLHLETQDAGQTFVRDVQLPSCEQAAETAALIFAMALRAELEVAAEQTPVAVATPSTGPTPAATETSPTPPAPVPILAASSPIPAPAPPVAAPGPRPAVASQLSPTQPVKPPARVIPASEAPSVIPASDTSSAFDFAASLGGSVAWSLVPESLWAIAASGAWLPAPWRFEVTASFAPAQRFALTSDVTRGGEFVWWSAGARGCYSLHELQTGGSPLGAFACLGAEGGQLRAVGFGTTLNERGVSPWIAVNGGLGGVLRLIERLRLLVRLELVAPLWRDRFVLENTQGAGLVARPGSVVTKLGLGLEVPF